MMPELFGEFSVLVWSDFGTILTFYSLKKVFFCLCLCPSCSKFALWVSQPPPVMTAITIMALIVSTASTIRVEGEPVESIGFMVYPRHQQTYLMLSKLIWESTDVTSERMALNTTVKLGLIPFNLCVSFDVNTGDIHCTISDSQVFLCCRSFISITLSAFDASEPTVVNTFYSLDSMLCFKGFLLLFLKEMYLCCESLL